MARVVGVAESQAKLLPVSLTFNLGDLEQGNRCLALPSSIRNEEALYAIVWKTAPQHEPLMRVSGGGGVIRFGSAGAGRLRVRCLAALRALT